MLRDDSNDEGIFYNGLSRLSLIFYHYIRFFTIDHEYFFKVFLSLIGANCDIWEEINSKYFHKVRDIERT